MHYTASATSAHSHRRASAAIDAFGTNGSTMEPMARFLSATAYSGKLYIEDILDRHPCDGS